MCEIKFFFFFVIFRNVPLKWMQNHYSGMRNKSPISILSKLIMWSHGHIFVEKKINIFFCQKNKKFQYKVTFLIVFCHFYEYINYNWGKKNFAPKFKFLTTVGGASAISPHPLYTSIATGIMKSNCYFSLIHGYEHWEVRYLKLTISQWHSVMLTWISL